MEGKFRKGFVVLRWYVPCSFYLMHGWWMFEIHISSFSGIAHHQQQQPLQKWNYAAPWCVMREEKTPECYFLCSARRRIKWIIKLLYSFEGGWISYFMFIYILCKLVKSWATIILKRTRNNIAYIYLDDFNIIISNTVSTWDIISFVPTKMCVILKLTVASWH